MTLRLEYHKAVQRSIPASLALFGMLLLPLLLLSSSSAQINGTPASVTSPGFGGRAINGTPPSVTSLGRNGFAPPNSGVNFHNQFPHNGGGHHHHHVVNGSAYYPYVYAVPVPYAVDVNQSDAANEDDDSYYQGGPTIFDRRGSGRDSYIPPSYPGPAHPDAAKQAGSMPTDDPPASDSSSVLPPEAPQPSTILVFKDGRQLEVGNYAIVSQT